MEPASEIQIKEGLEGVSIEEEEKKSGINEVDIKEVNEVCNNVVSHLPQIREAINTALDELEHKKEFDL